MMSTISSMRRELTWARRSLVAGFSRYVVDIMAYRMLRLFPRFPSRNSEGRLTTREGIQITYRRNRGDILSLREVFIDHAYRLPDIGSPQTLVDLGGNIGLATLWLANKHPSITKVVVVEPSSSNANLAERNLAASKLDAEVVTAAVASYSGTAQFIVEDSSNSGRIAKGGDGLTVTTITMEEVLGHIGGHIDILKMDIEGGEQDLLTASDLSWLDAVDCIVAELHPTMVDYERLTSTLVDRGFQHRRLNSLPPNQIDVFVRGDG